MIYRVAVYCTALSLLVGCGVEMPEQTEPKVRYVTNKSIAGVSMGGGAAAQIGLSQPERWTSSAFGRATRGPSRLCSHDPTRLDGRLLLTGVLGDITCPGT